MSTIQERLAQMNELDKKRTAGEWEVGKYFICNDHQPFYITHHMAEQEVCSVSVVEDAQFIAAVPEMLALANELAAENKRLRDALLIEQKRHDALGTPEPIRRNVDHALQGKPESGGV